MTPPPISDQTTFIYLPVIKSILGSLEVQALRYKDNPRVKEVSIMHLEKDHDYTKLKEAMELINTWLEGSDFKVVRLFSFEKGSEKSTWSQLIEIIRSRLTNFNVKDALIEITISPAGRLTRVTNGHTFACDLGEDGFKLKTIYQLMIPNGFIKTTDLKTRTGSKSIGAVSKTIGTINKKVGLDLHIKNFIDSKKGSGYRINPNYNLIPVK